jgi:hypothetical protein
MKKSAAKEKMATARKPGVGYQEKFNSAYPCLTILGEGAAREARAGDDGHIIECYHILAMVRGNLCYLGGCPLAACMERFFKPIIEALENDIADVDWNLRKEIDSAMSHHDSNWGEY